MTPGSVTELIWHFAGHLHIAEDVVRDRLLYQDGALKNLADDYRINLGGSSPTWDLDEFDTRPIKSPALDASDTPITLHLHAVAHHALQTPPALPLKAPPFEKPLIPIPPGGGGSAPAISHNIKISVTYQNGGDQALFEINQLNMLNDDDQLLVISNSGVTSLHHIGIAETLEDMVDAATNHVPEDLVIPQGGQMSAVAFLSARDAETAAGGVHDDEDSVAPGKYVNGKLQDESGSSPTSPDESTPIPPPDADGGKLELAKLGENTATNAALIVDLNEATGTMIVLGDYFQTNAIIQTNSFIDDDQVAVTSALPAQMTTGGNTADNIAEFIHESGIYGTVPGSFAGLKWNVDVVDGDFYNITLLTQKNFLHDNDVTVQEMQEAHYEVYAGENGQINLTQLYNWGLQYDVIIVAGSYHGANLIFQHNILLDNDILKIVSGDAPTSQYALTGENALLNDATIATYGSDNFAPLTPGLEDLTAALADRNTELDPALGKLIAGNGTGTLNVLYVTGDYYNINAIWQLNVIADVDTAIQFFPSLADGDRTQFASAGGNEATNSATIVDVGATSSFLGGDFYEDSILVQADLVASDEDDIVYGDTETLIAEVIAFTGPPDSEPQNDTLPTTDPNHHDDTMGSVMT